MGLIPGSMKSPGGGHGNPSQCSCLPIDRGAWQATVHRFTKSWTQLKRLSTTCGTKHLQYGQSKLICTVKVKYTLDFEDFSVKVKGSSAQFSSVTQSCPTQLINILYTLKIEIIFWTYWVKHINKIITTVSFLLLYHGYYKILSYTCACIVFLLNSGGSRSLLFQVWSLDQSHHSGTCQQF